MIVSIPSNPFGFQILEFITVKNRASLDGFEIKRAMQMPERPALSLGRYFAGRKAMDIEGLGHALIDQLVDDGLVKSLPAVSAMRPPME